MPDDIAVLIVNHRTAPLAIAAVDSVLSRPADGLRVTVHVVDNASSDADRALLRAAQARWSDAVRLHLEPVNHGFGRGNNIVLQELAALPDPPDKVYLLNPDAQVIGTALADLAAFLDAHPAAAVAGSAILHADTGEPACCAFRFPGVLSEFEAALSLGPVSRMLARHAVALPAVIGTRQVDWVSGASMMARLGPLRDVGFFDPDFFLYFEEVDLMRRLRGRGWQVWHVAEARIRHVAGAATGIRSGTPRPPPLPGYWFDSWRMYFVKQHGPAGARLAALSRWTGTVLGAGIGLLRGRRPRAPQDFAGDFARRVMLPLFLGRAGRA